MAKNFKDEGSPMGVRDDAGASEKAASPLSLRVKRVRTRVSSSVNTGDCNNSDYSPHCYLSIFW